MTDISWLIGPCCSLLCCLVFTVAIIGGIVFVLKKRSEGDEAADVSNEVDAEETQKISDVDAGENQAESAAPADEEVATPKAVEEPAPEPPPVSPKAAGQTIIAFDDDDEDF